MEKALGQGTVGGTHLHCVFELPRLFLISRGFLCLNFTGAETQLHSPTTGECDWAEDLSVPMILSSSVNTRKGKRT